MSEATPDDAGLLTSEGVQEGSQASTAEEPRTDTDGAERAAAGRLPDAPVAAPPVDMESADSREARERSATGQQLSAGEG